MLYKVQGEDGWLDGAYRRQGDIVEMPEAAAKWLVLNGQLQTVAADETPAASEPDRGSKVRASSRRTAADV